MADPSAKLVPSLCNPPDSALDDSETESLYSTPPESPESTSRPQSTEQPMLTSQAQPEEDLSRSEDLQAAEELILLALMASPTPSHC